MLMTKTFRWHAVIHVRTKGHPISNFEKELAKRTRVNFEPRASQGGNRKLRWLSHPCFETAKLKRGIIASDAEIKPSSNDRWQTKNKVITLTNHEQANQRAMNRPVFQATTCKRGNNHAYKMQEDGANFLGQSQSLAIVIALNSTAQNQFYHEETFSRSGLLFLSGLAVFFVLDHVLFSFSNHRPRLKVEEQDL